MEKNNKKERENLVRKYFIPTPRHPNYFWNYFWLLAAAGLIGFPFFYSHLAPNTQRYILFAGALILIIVLIQYSAKRSRYKLAYNLAEPKASDEQMDNWLDEGKAMILTTAKERLDIDADDISSHPLIIDGPASQTSIKPGKDKILRFITHNILLFFLTEHNVSIFQCHFNLGLGEILEDKTKEFPYKDITNLETETSTDTFYYENETKTKIDGVKSFSLFTSGGNKISINYFFIKNITDSDGYRFPPADDENTIKAIRKRLKEYKDKFTGGGSQHSS